VIGTTEYFNHEDVICGMRLWSNNCMNHNCYITPHGKHYVVQHLILITLLDIPFDSRSLLDKTLDSKNTLGMPLDRKNIIWKKKHLKRRGSRDSVVGIAAGYRLDERGVRVRFAVGSRIFSSPRCPDRHLGPPNLLSIGYRGLAAPSDGKSVVLNIAWQRWHYSVRHLTETILFYRNFVRQHYSAHLIKTTLLVSPWREQQSCPHHLIEATLFSTTPRRNINLRTTWHEQHYFQHQLRGTILVATQLHKWVHVDHNSRKSVRDFYYHLLIRAAICVKVLAWAGLRWR
jgi:hypothetical protein